MIKILDKVNLRLLNKFRVDNYECHLDEDTKRVYLIITPVYKYIPIRIFLDDLINDNKKLTKLEFKSLQYVCSIYGVINSQAKNNFYTLTEILITDNMIRIQNLSSLDFEIWDKSYFEKNYCLLDKKSLKQVAEFFSTIHINVIETITTE